MPDDGEAADLDPTRRKPRHGVVVTAGRDTTDAVLLVERALTRRGARRKFAKLESLLETGMMMFVGHRPEVVLMSLIESRHVVDERVIPLPPESEDTGPDSGVREPRRPGPFGGAATAVVDPQDPV